MSFTSTVFIYTHTTIAPTVTTSIILNAMAFVVVSRSWPPSVVDCSVTTTVYHRKLSDSSLLSPGKGAERVKWSSKRQVEKASP